MSDGLYVIGVFNIAGLGHYLAQLAAGLKPRAISCRPYGTVRAL